MSQLILYRNAVALALLPAFDIIIKATMAGPRQFYLHWYVSLNKLKQVAFGIWKVYISMGYCSNEVYL